MTQLILLSARLLDPATGSLLPHSAVAVTGGRITALGDDREIRSLAGRSTTVLDLGGAVVTPGLVDGHTHPVSGAELTRGLDLSRCTDLAGLRAELSAARRSLRRGEWLLGWGLDPNAFGTAELSAAMIGSELAGIPALLQLFDAHSAIASPAALALAGIDGPRTFVQAAEVVCDADGRPTGLLLEEGAVELVERAVPQPSPAQRRERLATVLSEMAATGLTGGHVMDAHGDSLELLADLDDADRLPIRLRVAPICQPGTPVGEVLARQGHGGRRWSVAGVKLFMDGTIDNGTAWLDHPDCHGESTAAFWPDPAEFSRVVTELHRAGVPTATHAIGDAAVRHVLDTIEKARTEGDSGLRHRIEHIETVPDDTVGRFAELGVVASMQPTHCTEFTRADHSDNWSRRLGPDRAGNAWRCRDLVDTGATVVLGSDWPIAPYPPLGVLAGARHRRPSRDLTQPPHGAAQALTPQQALQGMTVAPAWVAGEESVAGRLAVGCRADLTAFADDPVAVPDADLAALPVLLTVLDGRVTHRAGQV